MQTEALSLFGLDENSLRFGLFLSVFVVMTATEWLLPRRERTQPQAKRWATNWSIIFVDVLAVRLIMPIVPVGAAFYAEAQGWGLLNMVELPAFLAGLIAFVVLDFAIWLQHLISHVVPIFWRLHQMHHADRDIDVSTALRFHPIEILLSLVYKMIWIFVLAAPAMAVFLFEAVLNAAALFNHANVRIPLPVDRVLRWFVVTPDMHRVHHSVKPEETNSNYGFNLSIWDRMFGTYVAHPDDGHQDMTIGLRPYQSNKPSEFIWSLLLPFRNK